MAKKHDIENPYIPDLDNSPQYLERFFRNLLLGEQMPLHNRDLHIQDKYRTSSGQVQDKFGTSNLINTGNQLYTEDENTIRLVQAMGDKKLSIKEIMTAIGLKGRDNFLNLYLNPAMKNGFVRLLYPDSPRHPRQKYLLTVKGMMLLNQLSNK